MVDLATSVDPRRRPSMSDMTTFLTNVSGRLLREDGHPAVAAARAFGEVVATPSVEHPVEHLGVADGSGRNGSSGGGSGVDGGVGSGSVLAVGTSNGNGGGSIGAVGISNGGYGDWGGGGGGGGSATSRTPIQVGGGKATTTRGARSPVPTLSSIPEEEAVGRPGVQESLGVAPLSDTPAWKEKSKNKVVTHRVGQYKVPGPTVGQGYVVRQPGGRQGHWRELSPAGPLATGHLWSQSCSTPTATSACLRCAESRGANTSGSDATLPAGASVTRLPGSLR